MRNVVSSKSFCDAFFNRRSQQEQRGLVHYALPGGGRRSQKASDPSCRAAIGLISFFPAAQQVILLITLFLTFLLSIFFSSKENELSVVKIKFPV